jgi:hypothetical protein
MIFLELLRYLLASRQTIHGISANAIGNHQPATHRGDADDRRGAPALRQLAA